MALSADAEREVVAGVVFRSVGDFADEVEDAFVLSIQDAPVLVPSAPQIEACNLCA